MVHRERFLSSYSPALCIKNKKADFGNSKLSEIELNFSARFEGFTPLLNRLCPS